MIDITDLAVDTRVQAILVLDEQGSEHDDAPERERRWVKYEVSAVYLPALCTLCVERTVGPSARRNGETTRFAVIVDDHAAAVRMAVGFADAAKAAAKDKAKER